MLKLLAMLNPDLLQKYNVQVPRYTSYPTVPAWNEHIEVKDWEGAFRKEFEASNQQKGISLYIHLPFCESLCTYCGCNKRITTNHGEEIDYIGAILAEWAIYCGLMKETPVIRELHLGGGTPTFFSPENLEKLLTSIYKTAIIHPEHEFSFEGHPNNTTRAHLQKLYDLGFRRVSYGVQDNDPEVQRIINRIQPFANVEQATRTAREIGYLSVNYDLIYGLPRQTIAGMIHTIEQVISQRPDRVAFYSYAHVPWTSRGQRLFNDNDLPGAGEKLELYRTGKELFIENGYVDIGMDHFALPTDDLYVASTEGRLHRNFMGYTTQATNILVGLGVSSISSTGSAFAQNAKTLNNYYQHIKSNTLAVEKGFFLSEEDVRFGKYILDIICRGTTTFQSQDLETIKTYCMSELRKLETDELILVGNCSVKVTPLGKNFIRNICCAFDLYIQKNKAVDEKKIFSRAI